MFKNTVVNYQKGMFCGWPANGAVWSWGNEILVCYSMGHYKFNSETHSIDRDKPVKVMLARSTDGGETWCNEVNEDINNISDIKQIPDNSFDFKAPGFALLVCSVKWNEGYRRGMMISYDRGRTWEGPYPLPKAPGEVTARTDYITKDSKRCIMFLSHETQGIDCTVFSDRAYAAETEDGGKTWKMLGYITNDNVRSVMPSTVEIAKDHFITSIRRRKDKVLVNEEEAAAIVKSGKKIPTYQYNWIEIRESTDGGRTWEFSSKSPTAPEGEKGHNGNPPALSLLPDGRLVLCHGYRGDEPKIKARVSSDNGKTWADEIILRDDPISDDIGYPRMVVRPDGSLVTIYYYTSKELPEQHIEATIWKPV